MSRKTAIAVALFVLAESIDIVLPLLAIMVIALVCGRC
jgi:hypothetical protein